MIKKVFKSLFFNILGEDMFNIEFKKKDIKLDGVINEEEWENTSIINKFSSPWNLSEKDNTEFRCFFSKKFFNFSFKVFDNKLKYCEETDKQYVIKGDRVELFFSPTLALEKYYCLEISPNGIIYDYLAKYYRIFDDTWSFKGCEIVSKINEEGYIVEGRILIAELAKLSLNIYKGFYMGVYRADCKIIGESFDWFTWIDPKTETPDFHVSETFKFCKLLVS